MGLAQQFRGPNGHEVWANDRAALGCVRLAITGTDELGRQPIEDRWGGLLVFNGEVYEHQEILSQLGEPAVAGASDAE